MATGAGTVANPYILTTPADLDFIRTKLTSHFRLGADIDMSNYGNFTPIGAISPTTQRFTGVFDGNGYKIKGLKMIGTTTYTGFFTVVASGSVIKNLAITDAVVESSFNTTGIIAGVGLSNSLIKNCYTSGSINGNIVVGGIAGTMEGTIKNCFSFADVSGAERVFGIASIGGTTTAGIHYCHFYGTIDSVGDNKGAISSVSALTLNRSTNCYYDSERTGILNEVGTPLTTEEMQNGVRFTNWDTNLWNFEQGKYPYIKILGEPTFTVPANKETITVSSFTESIVSHLERSRRKVAVSLNYTHEVSSTLSKELTASCMSIIEEIVSSVETKVNANVKAYEVKSSFLEVVGSSQRIARTIRKIGSHIDLLGSQVTVIVPVEVEKPIYAMAYFVINQTAVSQSNSKTNINYLTNKLNVNSFTNTTEITHIENATETSVI